MADDDTATPVAFESGERQLRRLEVFLDVVYALLFFEMLQYLPPAEDMRWADEPLGLLGHLIAKPEELLRIVIGIGLTLIYWNLSNRLFGPLARTDGKHSTLSLVQMLFVCLFMYFAISDPALEGGPSSPALQSLSLAIAGFIALFGWLYAKKKELVQKEVTAEAQDGITRRSLIEPITALLNTPLAWAGPIAWTLGWLVIPLFVAPLVRRKG